MKNRGSILILVLWSLFFLTLLVVGLSHRVEGDINLARHIKSNTKMKMFAKAGIKMAMWKVSNDPTAEYDILNEAWHQDDALFKKRPLDDGYYSVYPRLGLERFGLEDEEAKININTASLDILKRLFEYAGEVTSEQALSLAASVLDWRDHDSNARLGGAEDSFYGYLNPPYPCKDKDFQALEELLAVKGFDIELYKKIEEFITVYSKGRVNINTAPAPVLLGLGFTEDLRKKILSFREGEDGLAGTSDDGAFFTTAEIAEKLDSAQGLSLAQRDQINKILDSSLIAVKSDFFSGVSEGILPTERLYRIRFVFNRDTEVVYWHED